MTDARCGAVTDEAVGGQTATFTLLGTILQYNNTTIQQYNRPPTRRHRPLVSRQGMPIDPTLLRLSKEGGDAELVLRSQQLRGGYGHAIIDVIKGLQQCDAQRRVAVSDLNIARRDLNEHKRSLRPGISNGDGIDDDCVDRGAIKKQMRELQTNVIPELQESVSKLEVRVGQELLPKLANIVDESAFSLDGQKVCEATSKDKEGGIINDPLFCLGGCKMLPTINPGKEAEKKSSQKWILTGCGVSISDALMKYANSFLNQRLCKDDPHSVGYKMLQCPATAPMDTISSHNLLGCSASCPVCAEDTSTFQVPSFITPATIHAGKSYPDAKLPIYHVFKTDERSGDSRGSHKKDVCRLFSHPTERISMFALTLPSLTCSRSLQDQMGGMLLDFFESLLVPSDKSKLSFANRNHRRTNVLLPMVQARTVDASSLAMNECRRIVVEGFLPSADSYIELASVCNTSDYVARALDIKSHGTKVGKCKSQGGSAEHLHIIHGTICDAQVALAWAMENNTARLSWSPEGTVIEGVALPRTLADSMHDVGEYEPHRLDDSVLFLPFCRRILVGKRGKAIVKKVEERSKLENLEGKSSAKEKVEFAINRPPTKREVEAEALNNPFAFLPIGMKF